MQVGIVAGANRRETKIQYAGQNQPGPVFMQRSTLPSSSEDSLTALAPSAQWMVLESGYKELASPSLTRVVPALFIAAIAPVTGQLWSLGWLLAVMMSQAAGRWAGAAFDRRSANAEPSPWVRHYRLTVASQAVCLGAGGLFAAAHDSLHACLFAATAIGFALTQAGAEPLPGAAAAPRLAILAGPMVMAAALRATLLHGGPGFLELAAVIVVWAAASALLARATASRLGAIAVALQEAPATVLDRVVPASPSDKDFQKLFGRDPLTALPNRHSFLRLLALESERAVLATAPVSLLVLDWIGYEEYHARQPQAAVDAALIELTNCIRTALRRRLDLLASLGNGRFALLLPATDAFGGEVVAKAALAAISPDDTGASEGACQSAVMIGCATYRGKGALAATELLEFAEEALRNARKTSGQSIRHYNPADKATRPPPFKGKRSKEDTLYSESAKPRLALPDPTAHRQFAQINPAVKQEQTAGLLQSQGAP
jgi:diguanylate cyclase (GGDEF)-like protein